MFTRLTQRRLAAMESAINAMLAGEDHAGDWPPDVSRLDLERARDWVTEQKSKRAVSAGDQHGS